MYIVRVLRTYFGTRLIGFHFLKIYHSYQRQLLITLHNSGSPPSFDRLLGEPGFESSRVPDPIAFYHV
jgi:hypothetical protein